MTNSFKWPVTIYYEDTDAGGVVYHSNYLKFFERARTELLRDKGISQHDLLAQNIGFVVRHIDIDFMQGAKLDDQLMVVTRVAELKKASIVFCQEIVNLEQRTLCKAIVKVACVNSEKMKPQAIPSSIIAELN
ncbi:tol-pal system-associated acyl-CoA thioesterase [Vibrio sp. TH_r3]|uniref:tol-pal system-associated acyl-CoA thioesterase n=1 Tax=Vibrio sp. TH_r3 TaxID=3082084 RepID=UPI00295520FA|nr:tol-pal system-associated acyl-CoA thioesterase [Vibrio sp. TH_r3]MDV7103876.1 tol-pal system-associated acyl-CoA thioesterase [Vibrio sp. TH_r3]